MKWSAGISRRVSLYLSQMSPCFTLLIQFNQNANSCFSFSCSSHFSLPVCCSGFGGWLTCCPDNCRPQAFSHIEQAVFSCSISTMPLCLLTFSSPYHASVRRSTRQRESLQKVPSRLSISSIVMCSNIGRNEGNMHYKLLLWIFWRTMSWRTLFEFNLDWQYARPWQIPCCKWTERKWTEIRKYSSKTRRQHIKDTF